VQNYLATAATFIEMMSNISVVQFDASILEYYDKQQNLTI